MHSSRLFFVVGSVVSLQAATCFAPGTSTIGRTAHSSHRAPITIAQYSGDTSRGLENLSPEQQKAFVAVTQDESYTLSSLVGNQIWDSVRESYPALADFSDEELSETLNTYISTPPTLSDIVFKTPVGPVVIINIVLAVTGFSWCDVPFANPDTQACIEVARRAAGS